MVRFCKISSFLAAAVLLAASAGAQSQIDNQRKASLFRCDQNNSGFCTELRHDQQFNGHYSGHDEPALLFYSDKPGSGTNALYHLTLPVDPPVAPRQDGTGGTFNFQLHSAFWFGMVLCDPQSSPNFTSTCVPGTDANIFDNADPNSPDFIGHHPGSAFLELQFYPPGGVNTCSDPTQWCVAMAIFSFNIRPTNRINNLDCRQKVGLEPSNFAFLTTTGIAQSPADPLNPDVNNKFGVFPGTTFQMSPGDNLVLDMHDTPDGLQVVIHDTTTGTTGSMTASTANGFAHVNFNPDPAPPQPRNTCTSSPFAFHPMYSTSSEHTRSAWTAHTYNISFSDEVGHFELCNAVNQEGGNCIQAGVDDPQGLDDDDTGCFTATDFWLYSGCNQLDHVLMATSILTELPIRHAGPEQETRKRMRNLSPLQSASPVPSSKGLVEGMITCGNITALHLRPILLESSLKAIRLVTSLMAARAAPILQLARPSIRSSAPPSMKESAPGSSVAQPSPVPPIISAVLLPLNLVPFPV